MFSEQLKIARKRAGKTQIQLANELSVANGTVAMWETGKREPDFDMLKKIAAALGVTTGYLMEESGVLETLMDGQDGMDAARAMLEQQRADKKPEDAKEADKWDKLFSAPQKTAPDDEKRLVGLYRQLNHDGQEKLLETADDMVQSGKYISTATGGQKRDEEKMA